MVYQHIRPYPYMFMDRLWWLKYAVKLNY